MVAQYWSSHAQFMSYKMNGIQRDKFLHSGIFFFFFYMSGSKEHEIFIIEIYMFR